MDWRILKKHHGRVGVRIGVDMSDTNQSSSKSSSVVSTSEETKAKQPNTFSLVPPQQESIGNGLLLLDGASSQMPIVAPELETQRRVAADPSRSLPERLEAYEDIMDSEVGDTTLVRARNVERELGLRQIYLKFEGGNPTGTQKDRIAFAQVMDAMRRGFDAITVATCGNYGVALALAASMAGLKCLIYIPEGYHTKRVQEMTDLGAQIVRAAGDYEQAVILSRKQAESEEIYDANPGGANTALQLKAYGEIAYEIYDELRDAPAAVAVPVSNGSTLAGIYKGFLSLYRRGKTSRLPLMVAGSAHGKNPIIRAFLKNTPACEDLKPEQIRETAVNEPLINWHSFDGDQALEAIRKSGGWSSYASDKSMVTYSRLLRDKEGLSILPASTAGLSVLLERHSKEPLPGDRYVVILTGRKS
jgi:threonine synthase